MYLKNSDIDTFIFQWNCPKIKTERRTIIRIDKRKEKTRPLNLWMAELCLLCKINKPSINNHKLSQGDENEIIIWNQQFGKIIHNEKPARNNRHRINCFPLDSMSIDLKTNQYFYDLPADELEQFAVEDGVLQFFINSKKHQ